MKRIANILVSSILLILTLMGTEGVSVERCSCTGQISLVIPVTDGCCPNESGCMTIETMHLSDYLPTVSTCIDTPPQPLFIALFKPYSPTLSSAWRLDNPKTEEAPPGTTVETVTVLRV